jgi:hypothetical protein
MDTNLKLGDLARDKISGFEGVITTWTNWLNGCVRVGLTPKKLHDGKPIDSCVFDIEQVELVTESEPKKSQLTEETKTWKRK